MLRPIAERDRLRKDLPKPYVDSGLKGGNLLQLGLRMARCRMLRATDEIRGEVGLLTVIKSSTWIEGNGSDSYWKVTQRLVFDQRFHNSSWSLPPWTGLGGPGGFAGINVVGADESPSDQPGYGRGGDIPNYYYKLGIPSHVSSFFALPELSADAVRQHLRAEGSEDLIDDLGEGQYLGLAVLAMGWSWAVYLAQSALTDRIFVAGS